jgi:hypothetical protein
MARYPKARWDPISGPAGAYTSGPWKVVHHKTQGATIAGARAAFRANKSDPHFTVHPGGVDQHIDTGDAARSLRNVAGGVQTNRDCAIQIETVGFSGVDMPDSTLNHLVELLLWLTATHGVPWEWPEGRPPTTSAGGYGQSNGERHPVVWDGRGGHYGHSQVPENDHWDPAYTDREWWILNVRCGPLQQPPGASAPDLPGTRHTLEGDPVMRLPVRVQLDANGNGETGPDEGLDVDHARLLSTSNLAIHSPNYGAPGEGYWVVPVGDSDRGGKLVVQVNGDDPRLAGATVYPIVVIAD